jgi:hypothetical protein
LPWRCISPRRSACRKDSAAAERRLVDLGNYEAELSYFPVAFRPGLHRPPLHEIETSPATVAAGAYAADYVYTWKMPPRSLPDYDLVATNGDARLYARKMRSPPGPG